MADSLDITRMFTMTMLSEGNLPLHLLQFHLHPAVLCLAVITSPLGQRKLSNLWCGCIQESNQPAASLILGHTP